MSVEDIEVAVEVTQPLSVTVSESQPISVVVGDTQPIDITIDKTIVTVEGSDHSALTNLDYASAGHTGFVGTSDLIAGYVPYTGATQDVDLGNRNLKSNELIYSYLGPGFGKITSIDATEGLKLTENGSTKVQLRYYDDPIYSASLVASADGGFLVQNAGGELSFGTSDSNDINIKAGAAGLGTINLQSDVLMEDKNLWNWENSEDYGANQKVSGLVGGEVQLWYQDFTGAAYTWRSSRIYQSNEDLEIDNDSGSIILRPDIFGGGQVEVLGTIDMNSSEFVPNKIINLTDPTADQDAATKKYVDDNSSTGLWETDGDYIKPINDDNVLIEKVDPEIRLTDTTDDEYTRVVKSDGANVATRYNRVSVQPAAVTSYSNPGGQGDRTSLITVTSTVSNSGDLPYIVNGSKGNGFLFYNVSVTGLYVRFYFNGLSKLIDEATWFQGNTAPAGTWQWQGSDNGTDWTNIGNQFVMAGAVESVQTELNSNTVAYKYYQLYGITGSMQPYGTTYHREMEFKIADANPTIEEAQIWSSQDGTGPEEKGIQTYGDQDGRTVIEGQTTRFNNQGTEYMDMDSSGLHSVDNFAHTFGTADDMEIKHDGSDGLFNISTGDFVFTGGDVKVDNSSIIYPSSDSTSAIKIMASNKTSNVAIFDTTNQSVAIGGFSSPGATLDINSGSGGGGSGIRLYQFTNNANTALSYSPIDFQNTSGLVGQFLATAPNYNNTGVNLDANSIGLFAESTAGQLTLGAIGSSGYISFNTGGFGTSNERLQIDSSGDIRLPADNQKLYFGAGDDMSISHDGANGLFELNTGSFKFNRQSVFTSQDNLPTTDILTFLPLNESLGMAFWYSGIRAVSTSANAPIDISSKGTESVTFQGNSNTRVGSGGTYMYANGLRLGGADTANTIYNGTTAMGITTNNAEISLGTQISTKHLTIDTSGDIHLKNDNQKLYFGAGDDVYSGFTGTNYETVGTGNWNISGFSAFNTQTGRIKNTTRVTTTYTILTTDDIIFANSDAGAYTVTLPAGVEGQTFKIINSGSNTTNLTVAPNGVEHLLGANSSITLNDGENLTITYNATDGWY